MSLCGNTSSIGCNVHQYSFKPGIREPETHWSGLFVSRICELAVLRVKPDTFQYRIVTTSECPTRVQYMSLYGHDASRSCKSNWY